MKNFIGKKFIDFTIPAVMTDGSINKNFNFYKETENKNVLIFFYPMDFTFVCPSELIAINNRISDFKSRNVEVFGISVDSCYSHNAWIKTSLENGGLGGSLNYVLLSDIKKDISGYLGVLDDISGVSYRASFVLDAFKTVKVQHINDFPIGRNIDEYIRLFDAISFYNEYGNVCQAGWVSGSSGIKPSSDGIGSFLKSNYKNL